MNIHGTPTRSIRPLADRSGVEIIDQTRLPHELVFRTLTSQEDAAEAIRVMRVRGAPLIGATAAYGLALALAEEASDAHLDAACARLAATRPTAVNLRWALERMTAHLKPLPPRHRRDAAWAEAAAICDEDVALNRAIGHHGLGLIRDLQRRRSVTLTDMAKATPEDERGHVRSLTLSPSGPLSRPLSLRERGGSSLPSPTGGGVGGEGWGGELREPAAPTFTLNVMTHCNAGWLATVDWGTALAPVYAAFDSGLPLHVWVSETRPRNQGAALTAWELACHGVPHTVIADNAAGHLMRQGQVDLVIVGADRVAANGDVANKIGTYLKALAAHDNGIPFYVAVPGPSIDWRLTDGGGIPIETRAPAEVTHIQGLTEGGEVTRVCLTPEASPAHNPAFDVTPARLVTGLITERGVCPASPQGLRGLYPEHAHG